MIHRLRVIPILVLLILSALNIHGANIDVNQFELITKGTLNNGTFSLGTRGDIDLAFSGGYKFGGELNFQLGNDNLEDTGRIPETYDAQEISKVMNRYLKFKSAKLMVREIFEGPVDFTFFTGETDNFGTGDDFFRLFGTNQIGTQYRGYMYFPSGVIYEGLYQINGTGIDLSTTPTLSDRLVFSTYLYQDSKYGLGTYTGDFRMLMNFELVKMDFFIGSSFPYSTYGQYHGGVMMFFDTGTGQEFFLQIGLPHLDPKTDTSIKREMFYVLFEPRILIEPLAIIPTVFVRPQYYNSKETSDAGMADFNVNFQIGDLSESLYSGGLEFNFQKYTDLKISPYFKMNESGVLWSFKLNVNVLPWDITNMFEAFIGIRTEY